MSDIYSLFNEATGGLSSPEYREKMMHVVPQAVVIEREIYLLRAAKDKIILDIGASGLMSDLLKQVTKQYHSIDKANAEWNIDLDDTTLGSLPEIPGLEIIIAGEVIEHLSNPGHFLDLLKHYAVPVIITTPNAYTTVGEYWIKQGIECINREHVAYYSYHTLRTLVERHGFKVVEWYWYKGKPLIAEGLIFRVEGNDA